MPALLPVSEALERLLAAFQPTALERVALADSCGRVLGEDVSAADDYPPFTNSSMDGFALRSVDVAAASRRNPISLAVVDDIPAGRASTVTLHPGQAARIMTGAPLPNGADAVIPVEETDFSSRAPGLQLPPQVQAYQSVRLGDFVRPRGQDIRSGDAVLLAGGRLRPQDVGLLATLGISQVMVHRRPRVAVITTGDELLPVDQPLRPGTIHESNSYVLAGQIQSCGAELLPRGVIPDIIPDDPAAVESALDRAAAAGVDMILSSAGVSVGVFDFVRPVVQQHGSLDFWRVNIRPGKPIAFGSYRSIPFMGLPGNPVSTFVSFEVFARPALGKLSGLRKWRRSTVQAELLEPIESDGRESYLRANLTWQSDHFLARLAGHQGSGNLRGLTEANALLIIPSEVKSLPSGARVMAWWLDETLTG